MNSKPSFQSRIRLKLLPMAESHLDQVFEIEKKCFTEPWSVQAFRDLTGREKTLCLVALDNDKVIGYSCSWIVVDAAELGNLAVDPDHQGRSVGGALLEKTVEICRKHKVVNIFLEVRQSNHRAIALYERYGFKQIGLRRNYYSSPREDALIMKLDL